MNTLLMHFLYNMHPGSIQVDEYKTIKIWKADLGH